jgi:N-acetylmuramoyl-L-alanine amidase
VPFRVKRIVLNIGHGGGDSGAIGADGTEEHAFNRDELGPLVKRELESLGWEVSVVIQRKSFGELPARINALNPDLILSLHFNCADGTATGTETLYFGRSRVSRAFAEKVQAAMVKALGLPDRGAKGITQGRGVALLRNTKAPCLILEPFFGDNPNDLARARERLGDLAEEIAGAT